MAQKISEALRREASDMETDPQRLRKLAENQALMHLVAANPATPAETLSQLATGKNRAVLAAVAENPNAPFEALRLLLAEYTERVLNNPALPFLLIENPALPIKLSLDDLLSMLRFERMPRVFLAHALYLPEGAVRRQALAHVQVAGEVGANWRLVLTRQFGETVRLHAEDTLLFQVPELWPSAFLETLLDRAECHSFLAWCPDLTSEMFDLLVESSSDHAVANLTMNRNTTPSALARLAEHPSADLRAAVARHPNVRPATLARLAQDAHGSVRGTTAAAPQMPEEALRLLAQDAEATVRAAVAGHSALPDAALTLLARDRAATVRAGVAGNARTHPDLLATLALDREPCVRAAVARNAQTPLETYVHLGHDAAMEVREAAAESSLLTAEVAKWLLGFKLPRLRERIAANPMLTPDLMTRLLQTPSDQAVMRGLARNPRTTPATLIWLAGHPNPAVRRIVSANPALPLEAQGKLAEKRDRETHLALAGNPATSLSILARLGTTKADDDLLLATVWHPLMNAATRQSIYASYFMLQSMGTDAEKLRQLALVAGILLPSNPRGYDSPDWLDRIEIAQQMKVPKGTLVRLSQDGNRFVRAAARESLAAQAHPADTQFR